MTIGTLGKDNKRENVHFNLPKFATYDTDSLKPQEQFSILKNQQEQGNQKAVRKTHSREQIDSNMEARLCSQKQEGKA
jgi:hypothetical protein